MKAPFGTQALVWGLLALCFHPLYAQQNLTQSPSILNVLPQKDSIALYDKFEIGLNLKANFTNPYDPEEIDITATFTSPSGKEWKTFGFYNSNEYVIWRIRFAPDEVGNWKCKILVKDKNGKTESNTLSFVAIPSKHKGPLRLATNKRYLEHKNGKPFFGVGFWYNDGSGRIQGSDLDELKKFGVNFISSFITPIETLGTGVGRYDQQICKRLDDLLVLLEDRDLYLSMNIWFHSFLSETVWGGGNVRWPNTNPYQNITAAKDFYRSEEAWKYQEKMYRYLIARYGYSRSLALWFIVDEVNGTDGWVSGDSLQAGKWGQKIQGFFNQHDPYHHLTTGTRSGGKKEFWDEGYKTFDIAGREIYEAQGWPINKTSSVDSSQVHPLTLSYRNYRNELYKMWNLYEKPIIIGETGWDHTFYEFSMPGYLAMYHNALWTALATGSAMTPFWWAHSDRLNDNMINHQLTSIRDFSKHIPFSKLTNLKPVEASIPGGDAYAMKSDQFIFGWAVNAVTDVAGDQITLHSLNEGKYNLRIYHTWNGEFIGKPIETNTVNGTLTFRLPMTKITGGHAEYIGQDIAFILEPIPPPKKEENTVRPKRKK